MTRTTETDERRNAVAQLRGIFPPGSAAKTILRHVTASGMGRSISVISPADCEDVTWLVSRATGDKLDHKRGGIKVGGCGMDMGFALVYNLSRALYPDGFTCSGINPICPSNDHSNGDRDFSPHMHRDGGYAIRQRWL